MHAPVFLAGPTAVGKSETALLLAECIGGEIISVDSMQVYRGLDIGTAKPDLAQQQRVRHHLLDVVDLAASFDAAQFVQLASKAVQEIAARNRTPIFCGGTGLYFKAWLEGLGDAPPTDSELRKQLQATPLPDLLNELAESDPETFARIDQRNPRRVIRAVAVLRLTGKPFSEQRTVWASYAGRQTIANAFTLLRDRDELAQRIADRVDLMFERGLVAETAELLNKGLAANPTAMQAIGYRQVVEHLRGVWSLEETIQLVKSRTRQFAKRQLTWYQRQLPFSSANLEPGENAERVAMILSDRLRNQGAS
jgi:tRNA dimethylallyltransferase